MHAAGPLVVLVAELIARDRDHHDLIGDAELCPELLDGMAPDGRSVPLQTQPLVIAVQDPLFEVGERADVGIEFGGPQWLAFVVFHAIGECDAFGFGLIAGLSYDGPELVCDWQLPFRPVRFIDIVESEQRWQHERGCDHGGRQSARADLDRKRPTAQF